MILSIINTILSVPLGFVINRAYLLTNSYGLAILIFAFVARFLVVPVNILAHKNSIRLLNLQPSLSVIKKRYANDKEQFHEKQYNLFKREKYSPYVGLAPLFIQLFLIIGIFGVMRNPEQHISYLYTGILGTTPSFVNPSPALTVPFLAGLSALLFCIIQSALSPGALSQSKGTNLGLTVFTVGLMLYFAFIAPLSLGLYLIAWNLFSVVVVLLLNVMYNPKKLAGEALAYIKANRKLPAELKEDQLNNKALRKRERQDISRFRTAQKHLLFYAISGGQYKFYKCIIEYLLKHSGIEIHYLTNDANDSVFSIDNKQFIPYYISQKRMISLMLQLDVDILATTVPDLQSFHIKRSIKRDDIEYIHIFHGLVSTHLVYRQTAFDHFDTLLCVGPYHVAELRRREEMVGIKRKSLVKAGYGLYDQLVESYAAISDVKNDKPRILIAPSWQEDNILELCIEEIFNALIGNGFEIILRPHPQFLRMFPERVDALEKRYSEFSNSGEIKFELDFSGNESIFTSDILITDWSGIAIEFSYCTLKPSVFINTPMKIMNPNYLDYGLDVYDINVREKVGVSVNLDEIDSLGKVVSRLLSDKHAYEAQIRELIKENLYYPGRNGEAGGKYILGQLKSRGI